MSVTLSKRAQPPPASSNFSNEHDSSEHDLSRISETEGEKMKLYWFDSLSPTVQFGLLATGVFVFFGMHNYLQEAIMAVPGFKFGVMLSYPEVFGVAFCSFLERRFVAGERQRVAPLSSYLGLTFCLLGSSSLANLSLNYINYPTKVVFRSCKLIPTMIVASIVNKKIFSVVEYCCAFCMCVGLVFFAAADWSLAPSFHPVGLAFVSLSVCADAFLPNLQERLFGMGSTRLEVTFYTNIITLVAITFTTWLSGDLTECIYFVISSPHYTELCYMILVYTFIAYIAISCHMNIVRRFGGVSAVLLATARKGMTLVLSFLLFPKEFSWLYVLGALMVLGGLLASSLYKIRNKQKNPSGKRNQNEQQQQQQQRSIAMSPRVIPNGHDERTHKHES
mmetsp:Transcript_7378/g.18518  ORF Transcript_7378/g.18518 Transcript_7378/m.18518 type:complete len:392 (+) Transcript_7378:179-1354(+)